MLNNILFQRFYHDDHSIKYLCYHNHQDFNNDLRKIGLNIHNLANFFSTL